MDDKTRQREEKNGGQKHEKFVGQHAKSTIRHNRSDSLLFAVPHIYIERINLTSGSMHIRTPI